MTSQYRNAPLSEAVCEFRFEPGEPWDMAVPGLLYERLRDQFPKRRQVKGLDITISQEEASIRQQVTPMERLQFMRDDETALVQVAPHLLAVNQLRPYPGWESYQPMVLQALQEYRAVAQPQGFERIGLRYINRIELKATHVQIEDYLDFYPYVSERFPQPFSNFIVGVHLEYEERNMLRLRMRDVPAEDGNVTLVLDLDYFLNQPRTVTMEEVSEWLGSAHARIEEAFEACLKDPLRERFNRSDGL